MLVQVVDVLGDAVLERCAHADVVEDRQMLYILTETDAAGVRTHRNAEVRGQEKHGDHLVHATESTAVDLTKPDRASLHELFEHDAVLTLLAGGYADRMHRASDRGVSEHVVRTCWLLDPPRLEARELTHPFDRSADVPHLVGVHHQFARRADLFANDRRATDVVGEVAANFDLEMRPPIRNALTAQLTNLVVRVAQPTGGRRVCRVSVALELSHTLRA